MDEPNQHTQTGARASNASETTDSGSAEPGAAGWFPCPYCGERQAHGAVECRACGGLFEPLSRQATQNQMGPWFVRDESAPFVPGRSYATIRRMAQRGRITPETVLRGPSTRQFWMAAAETPGVAHLLGRCHSCKSRASAEEFSCSSCGAAFSVSEDRQSLGLAPVRLLPGQAAPALVARSASTGAPAPTAFARLADSSAPAKAPRPAAPAPLTPATEAVVGPTPPPTRLRPAGDAEGAPEAAALRRSLRIASRRVAALRNLVILLAIVNVVVVVVLLAMAFGGEGTATAPADASEAPAAASGSSR